MSKNRFFGGKSKIEILILEKGDIKICTSEATTKEQCWTGWKILRDGHFDRILEKDGIKGRNLPFILV